MPIGLTAQPGGARSGVGLGDTANLQDVAYRGGGAMEIQHMPMSAHESTYRRRLEDYLEFWS